ncbi:MAG: hypothetical protein ACD_75C00391G0002 [uncultured bacterium]|nr:MAG: hypothetical protein ACD_75C00391G0002 [uncultured bacterium]
MDIRTPASRASGPGCGAGRCPVIFNHSNGAILKKSHNESDIAKKCDSLISLGGGSSHDCGKGIGLVVANGVKIHDFEGVDKSSKPMPPYLAGMAFNNASLGHVHAMAHQLGGFYDLPHGECNAILLPHVQRANLNARLERYVDMAGFLGEKVDCLSLRAGTEKCLDAIKQLSTDIGIPSGLIALGKRYGKEVRRRHRHHDRSRKNFRNSVEEGLAYFSEYPLLKNRLTRQHRHSKKTRNERSLRPTFSKSQP